MYYSSLKKNLVGPWYILSLRLFLTFEQPAAVLYSHPLFVGFRLDRYRGDPKEEHKDVFDFECHIYVDDAFMMDKNKETGIEKKLVNTYVSDLINVVMEVYR